MCLHRRHGANNLACSWYGNQFELNAPPLNSQYIIMKEIHNMDEKLKQNIIQKSCPRVDKAIL